MPLARPRSGLGWPLLHLVSSDVMEETLEEAVGRLLGATPVAPPGGPPGRGAVQDLVRQAAQTYRHAQQLLRQGDLAGYAREIERLGEILRKLEETP